MTNPNQQFPIDAAAAVIAAAAASAKAEAPAALAAVKSKEAPGVLKRTNAYYVDPRAVSRKEGFNPRFDFGEIEELAKSIKVNGLLQPIRVRKTEPGKFELVDGDRRLTAIELILKNDPAAFSEGVHAIIVDKNLADIDALFQMFESNSGKAFLPLEEAAAYKRMRDAGLTLKQICARVGRKHVHIVATLALLDADQSLQDGVRDGSVNSTLAKKIAVAARGDKTRQAELVKDAKSAGKDKKARKAVQQKVEAVRQAKAKKEGRVLKIRALSDDQLGAIGEQMSVVLLTLMEGAGIAADADLMSWAQAGDTELKLAFTFGALQALKAAAGAPIPLTFD